MILFVWNVQTVKSTEAIKRLVFVRDWGDEDSLGIFSTGGNEKFLELTTGGVCTTLSTH